MLRAGVFATLVAAVLVAATVVLFIVAGANRSKNENQALDLRARDTLSLMMAIINEVDSTYTSTRLAALASGDDLDRFLELVPSKARTGAVTGLTLLTNVGPLGLGRTQVTASPTQPLLLSRFNDTNWLNLLGAGDKSTIVAIEKVAGSTIIATAVRVRDRDHSYLYGELNVSRIVQDSFSGGSQLEAALYAGSIETPLTMLASWAPKLPITGLRREYHVTISGNPALFVVGARGRLVNGFAAQAPEVLLSSGLFVSLTTALGVFSLVRRRDLAVARAHELGERNRRLDELAGHLSASEARFRELFEDASDAIFHIDANRIVTAVNRAGVRAAGRPRDEIVGRPLADLVVPDDVPALEAHLACDLDLHASDGLLELRMAAVKDRSVTLELSSRPIVGDGAAEGVQVIARDVTERLAFQHELARQAFHDPLTGLANRALLYDRVAHALHREERPGTVAVLVIDLDDFKTVNDSLGHSAGDALLGQVATRFRTHLRPGDTCARLGGDEFAVLIEGISSPRDTIAVAETLLGTLDDPFAVPGREAFVRASVGIATSLDGSEPAELLRAADIAMYQAKSRRAGPRWEVFRAEMLDAVTDRLTLTGELNRAVERGEFEVHYQPMVELASGAIGGLEALVRWRHPTRGLLPPGSFISLAEENGLIVQIGTIVLEEACCETVRREQAGHVLSVAVNVSGRQLQERGFVDVVARTLLRTGLHPQRLTLEITESVLLHDASVTSTLAELRSLGVRLAIDDFGSGYSSLDYLRRFPVDILKVDRSFVRTIRNERDVHFLEAIVQLADSLGLDTVAEGIETAEQRDHARHVRCTHGQGFHFSRPVPPCELDRLLDPHPPHGTTAA